MLSLFLCLELYELDTLAFRVNCEAVFLCLFGRIDMFTVNDEIFKDNVTQDTGMRLALRQTVRAASYERRAKLAACQRNATESHIFNGTTAKSPNGNMHMR